MAKLSIRPGATSTTVPLYITDASGNPRTGLAHNTAGLVCWYYRTRSAPVQITLATLANNAAAWSAGGFIEVSAANAPGHYRLDLPDAVAAAGAGVRSAVVVLRGAATMAQVQLEIDLDAEVDVAQVGNQTASASGAVNFSSLVIDSASVPTDAIADRILGRGLGGGSDGGRTVRDALRANRNRVVIDTVANTITVYREDDTTVAWSGTVTTTSGANPITGIDPA